MIGISTRIELQMSLLLFTALTCYLLATGLHQLAVVSVILEALYLGFSMLGWIIYASCIPRRSFVRSRVLTNLPTSTLNEKLLMLVLPLDTLIRKLFSSDLLALHDGFIRQAPYASILRMNLFTMISTAIILKYMFVGSFTEKPLQ